MVRSVPTRAETLGPGPTGFGPWIPALDMILKQLVHLREKMQCESNCLEICFYQNNFVFRFSSRLRAKIIFFVISF